MQGYSTTYWCNMETHFCSRNHNAGIVYTWIQYLNAGGKLIENFFYYHGNWNKFDSKGYGNRKTCFFCECFSDWTHIWPLSCFILFGCRHYVWNFAETLQSIKWILRTEFLWRVKQSWRSRENWFAHRQCNNREVHQASEASTCPTQ